MKELTVNIQGAEIVAHFEFEAHDTNWTFDTGNNPVSPGAKTLALRIADNFRAEGLECSEVAHHSYYGWVFTALYVHRKLEIVVNPLEADAFVTVGVPKTPCDLFWRKDFKERQRSIAILIEKILTKVQAGK